MSEVTIRPATPQDAELVDLLVREIAAHQDELDGVRANAGDWRAALARPEVRVLLAFDGAEPVGYVSLVRRLHLWSASDILALDDLWVRPEARNRGVGRDLMLAVAELAAPERLTVTWGARTDNEAAHRFYVRLGASIGTKTVFGWRPSG